MDTVILVDVSKSMLTSVYEALTDRNLASKKRENDGAIAYTLEPRAENKTLTFLRIGIKPRSGFMTALTNTPLVGGLVPSNQADKRVTENILFQSIRKIEAIVGDYSRGSITIVPFTTGPVNWSMRDIPLARFEFEIEGPSADREATKLDILRFLSPGVYGAWSKSATWRGLLEESIYNGAKQRPNKKINLVCRETFERLQEKIRALPKKDLPHSIQFVVFTDGDEENRTSQLGTLLEDYRRFSEQMGVWFEYRECSLCKERDLANAARDAHAKIAEAGFFVGNSPDFGRRFRFVPRADALALEVREPMVPKNTIPTIKVNVPIRVAADDGKAIDGRVSLRGRLKSPIGA